MVGIVIVTHGELANGLIDAMRMICGPQENVTAISLQEADDPENLKKCIHESFSLLNEGEGVLIMVDLFGATPFNTCMRLQLESQEKIEIICGVNLPMLVETILCRDGKDLHSLFERAEKAGKEGIRSSPAGLGRN